MLDSLIKHEGGGVQDTTPNIVVSRSCQNMKDKFDNTTIRN